jgi:hypothetical protein
MATDSWRNGGGAVGGLSATNALPYENCEDDDEGNAEERAAEVHAHMLVCSDHRFQGDVVSTGCATCRLCLTRVSGARLFVAFLQIC